MHFAYMQYHIKRIAVATDFSENALHALKTAVDLLYIPQSKLVLIHVDEANDDEKLQVLNHQLDDYIKNFFKYHEPVPVPERIILSNTSVYKALLDYIQKMDIFMLVMGMKGSSNIRNLHLGSNTIHLLEKAPCPVVVVPILQD